MKKILVVLLSLGLIAAFAATASAADAKFSGSYYVTGWYSNNKTLVDDNQTSAAAFWQRLRIQTEIQVAEGLKLTTRIDANEKGWGSTNWRNNADDMNLSRKQVPAAGNPNAQENIEFERGYMTFMTKIGQIQVGYQSSGKWGTDAFDDEKTRPRARIDMKSGAFSYGYIYEKQFETVYSAAQPNIVDGDNETHNFYGIYNFKGGSAGLLYVFADARSNRAAANFATKGHSFMPYVKATFGPVYIESELRYSTGKARKYDNGTADVDWDAFGGYLKAQAKMGPAYFGASVLYTPGDDGSDPNKKKDFVNASGNGSQDLDFGIYLANDALQTWRQGANFDSAKYNSTFYNVYGGYSPTPKMNLQAMVVFAQLNKVVTPAGATNNNTNKDLGWEVDLTASYKLYDNLTYMVGGAYFKTGDAFKGFGTGSANAKVGNDFLLLNRLTLSF